MLVNVSSACSKYPNTIDRLKSRSSSSSISNICSNVLRSKLSPRWGSETESSSLYDGRRLAGGPRSTGTTIRILRTPSSASWWAAVVAAAAVVTAAAAAVAVVVEAVTAGASMTL